MYRQLAVVCFLVSTTMAHAQNSIEQTLSAVRQNNKTLQAAAQYVDAKKLEYRTGNVPDNPEVAADYMIGRPVSGGNQFDLVAAQRIEFPTTYFKKGDLADERTKLVEIELQQMEQEVLLQAKELCLEVIYLNKYMAVLESRRQDIEGIVSSYQKQYELEQISVLELNKARMLLLGINAEMRSTKSNRQVKLAQLATLNGGNAVAISDTAYPVEYSVPALAALQDSIFAADLQLMWYQQQTSVYHSQVAVNKAQALPNLEAGYRYQSVLGQTFNGVHVGMSIPLWQHKNTVKAAKAHVALSSLQMEDSHTNHSYEIERLYKEYENLEKTIAEYREVLSGLNSEAILKKSLELGEINFISYGMELEYYYKYNNQLLQLEKDYQLVLAQLFKYQL